MKTIRKALALMLALCMVLALAACGSGDKPIESKAPESKAPDTTPSDQGGEPAAEVELLWWAPPTFIQDADDPAGTYEQKLVEEDYTSLDVAAALLKLAMGEENEDIAESGRLARSLDELDRYGWDRKDRGRGNSQGGRNPRSARQDRGDMVRLFVNIGKNQNVKPGDILGAIAGEAGIPGRMVGSIDMYDKYTFVEVPCDNAKVVMKAMKNAKIKGKSVRMEVAR